MAFLSLVSDTVLCRGIELSLQTGVTKKFTVTTNMHNFRNGIYLPVFCGLYLKQKKCKLNLPNQLSSISKKVFE